jgi:hypothetical protein
MENFSSSESNLPYNIMLSNIIVRAAIRVFHVHTENSRLLLTKRQVKCPFMSYQLEYLTLTRHTIPLLGIDRVQNFPNITSIKREIARRRSKRQVTCERRRHGIFEWAEIFSHTQRHGIQVQRHFETSRCES